MKKTSVKLLLAAFVSAALISCSGNQKESATEAASEQNEEKFEDSDKEDAAEFVVEAANSGMMEVEAGRVAQQKGSSQEVKQYGQMMVDDHTKANEELKALASTKNITVPAAIGQDKQDKLAKLQEKSGAEFDREFMDLMVSSHEDAVNLFEKQAENGSDPELKSWAAGKVTVLKQHLDHAKATKELVDKNQ